MTTDTQTKPDTTAANAARVRMLAEAAARNPVKLTRALRIVRAALAQDIITLDDLLDEAA